MRKVMAMLGLVGGLVMMSAFAVTVWPTQYTHSTLKGYPIRIDRLSGQAEVLTKYGWSTLGQPAAPRPAEAAITAPLPAAVQPMPVTQAVASVPCPKGEEWREFDTGSPFPLKPPCRVESEYQR